MGSTKKMKIFTFRLKQNRFKFGLENPVFLTKCTNKTGVIEGIYKIMKRCVSKLKNMKRKCKMLSQNTFF